MTLENELGSLAAKSLQKLCCLAKCNTTNEIRCLILIVPAERRSTASVNLAIALELSP